jgi:lipopolysaccharide export system protein LptA
VIRVVIWWLLGGLLVCSNAVAQKKYEGPVDIKSDQLIVKQKENIAEFIGNVVTRQGDLEIRCGKLVVTYSKQDKAQSGQISRMLFSQNVSIVMQNRKGHCKQALYDRVKRQIICTGDPWVIEGDNKIYGQKIEYSLKRDEVTVLKPKATILLENEHGHKPQRKSSP